MSMNEPGWGEGKGVFRLTSGGLVSSLASSPIRGFSAFSVDMTALSMRSASAAGNWSRHISDLRRNDC